MTDVNPTGVITQEVALYDSDGNPLLDCPNTRALPVIDFELHSVHDGEYFGYSEVVVQAQNVVYDIQITTPSGNKHAHLFIEFDVEAETEFWFYKNVSIVEPGTEITPQNHNHNSDNESILTVKGISNTSLSNANEDTVVSGATQIMHIIVGAGKKVGGGSGSRHLFILKAGEDYTIRWDSSDAGWISFHLDWYEHTDRSA